MIVRDEEKMLPRCLKSVRGVADELVVVDTGSKDNTISIAEDFGAKVFYFKWCDDFAAARNESLKHATGDWILQIDADEELPASSIPPLREAMSNPWCLVYVITCDNGSTCGSERFAEVGRLFRNHPSVRYSRPYHELLSSSAYNLIAQGLGWQVLHEPRIMIRHYGYEPSEMESRKKPERGLRIMESYVRVHPGDDYILTKLGETYSSVGRHNEAMDVFKKAVAINPKSADAHKGLGITYCANGMFDKAVVEFKEAIAVNPTVADVHNNLGMAYYSKGLLDKAISEYMEAIEIEPGFVEAHYNLGMAYGAQGRVDEEISEYRKVVILNPKLADAYSNLGAAYEDKGQWHEAVVAYKRAVAINPGLAQAHYNLAVVYYRVRQFQLAILHSDRAVELGWHLPPWFAQNLNAHRQTAKRSVREVPSKP
jgi:tetratricopeptide (TPR) repeat protein